MKIKITDSNAGKIQRALDAVNGRASEHTYCLYHDIARLVTEAETRRADLRLSKRDAKGMRVHCVSGARVPTSYDWQRKATWVELTYCATGWCLTEIHSFAVYYPGGFIRTVLTPAVEAVALEQFRTTYAVA